MFIDILPELPPDEGIGYVSFYIDEDDATEELMESVKKGLEELKEAIEEILRAQKVYIEKVYPYDLAGKIQLIRKYGQLLSEEYTESGIMVKAYVPSEIYSQI